MKRAFKRVLSIFLAVLYLSGYAGIGAHHCEHMDCECTHVEGCFHYHSDDGCCSDTYSPSQDQDCGDDGVTLPSGDTDAALFIAPEAPAAFRPLQVTRLYREAPPRAGVKPERTGVWRL